MPERCSSSAIPSASAPRSPPCAGGCSSGCASRPRPPGSPAELGLSRQRVNYHVRALERAGLVELVEERRRRGCTERILATRADAFVVDPAVLGAMRSVDAQDRHAAEHLIGAASDVVRDVARMQARRRPLRGRGC